MPQQDVLLVLGFAAVALGALGLAGFLVVRLYASVAAFQGSAIRFADAIDARATQKAQAMRPASPAPTMAEPAHGMPAYIPGLDLPPMPDELAARWNERTRDSNIPDRWPTVPEDA